MKIDIMFLVDHFSEHWKVFIFHCFVFSYIKNKYSKQFQNKTRWLIREDACDAKAQTPYENETAHLVSVATTGGGLFYEDLDFELQPLYTEAESTLFFFINLRTSKEGKWGRSTP